MPSVIRYVNSVNIRLVTYVKMKEKAHKKTQQIRNKQSAHENKFLIFQCLSYKSDPVVGFLM
ncbi:hypothetical protein AK965_08905 [Vibrio sp. PID17_43]|nr:hypothetical protein AK965_08905 [Vibrio sp. PID17_43]